MNLRFGTRNACQQSRNAFVCLLHALSELRILLSQCYCFSPQNGILTAQEMREIGELFDFLR